MDFNFCARSIPLGGEGGAETLLKYTQTHQPVDPEQPAQFQTLVTGRQRKNVKPYQFEGETPFSRNGERYTDAESMSSKQDATNRLRGTDW